MSRLVRLSLVFLLLGVLVVSCGKSYKGGIEEAIEKNDLDYVKKSVKQDPEIMNIALLSAVVNGNEEISEFLIEKGADVNTMEQGMTPLYSAVEMGNEKIVKLLVSKGADINAIGKGSPSGDAPPATPLVIAILREQKEMVILLIELGADVNKKVIVEEDSYSPLQCAGINEKPENPKVQKEIQEILRSHGATED